MIGVGFSTTSWPLSWLIRKITKCPYSHTWLYFVDDKGLTWVTEADFSGFVTIPYDKWKKGNKSIIVKVPKNQDELSKAYEACKAWIGEGYDYGGLVGAVIAVIGNWFRKKWHNPIQNSHQLFCSEAVAAVLKLSNYPDTSDITPADTSPLLVFNLIKDEETLTP